MMKYEHSPERDDEVLTEITALLLKRLSGDEVLSELIPLTKELMSITLKWRSKALMRARKIEELTEI